MEADHTNASTAPLGPLERLIHRAVRERGTATVREVLQDKEIWQRYNTVLTTMERLFRKGLLGRVLEGKAFRYWVQCSLEEFDRDAMVTSLRQLLRSDQASLHLSYFVEAVGAEDEELLNELQALVERQRAELPSRKVEK